MIYLIPAIIEVTFLVTAILMLLSPEGIWK